MANNFRVKNTDLARKVGEIDAQLEDIMTYDVFYRKPKNGKKIVFIGDSTTDSATTATNIYSRLNSLYTVSGGLLEGATIVPRGSNGGTLQNFIANYVGANGAYSGNTLQKCVDDQADLYVLSYGINDIRGGVNSPGRTQVQIQTDLKTAIDTLLNQTKGNILLRIPNTFLTTAMNDWIFPNEKAQEYSDQLWEIYESFRGYNSRVDIIDIPNLIFGRKALTAHPLMQDQLHPNADGYRAIADEIAEWIGGKKKKDLYNMDDYEVVLKGSIEGTAISNTYISFYTASNEVVKKGDVVVVGNSWSFVIDNEPLKNNDKWYITHSHTGNFLQYGTVKVLRKKERLVPTSDTQNNWYKAVIETTSVTNVYHVCALVDISTFNLGDVSDASVYTRFEYFTKEAKFNNIRANVFFNNDPTVITGGINIQMPLKKIVQLNEHDGYESQLKGNLTGYKYAHVFIMLEASDNIGLKSFEFRNFSFYIKNISIPISLVSWKKYLSTHRGYILENQYCTKNIVDYGSLKQSSVANKYQKALVNTQEDLQYFVETIVDLDGIATGDTVFETKIDYFTDNTSIKNIKSTFYINNSNVLGNLTNSVSGDSTKETIIYNEYGHYNGVLRKDILTNRYLHLFVAGDVVSQNDNNLEFYCRLWVNGQEVDIKNNTWQVFNGVAGSSISKIFNRNEIVTVQMLKDLGVI